MLQKYNRYRLLKILMDSPNESFRLRELSRLSMIAPPSVVNYLTEFEKDGLIRRYKKRETPFYQAIRDNADIILYKKISIVYELHKSGLIDFLWYKLSPEAIILYGSYAKGESIETSDMDLFIIGKEENIDLTKFEKELGKPIHLMFEKQLRKISDELKNNLINGIVIKGYLKMF